MDKFEEKQHQAESQIQFDLLNQQENFKKRLHARSKSRQKSMSMRSGHHNNSMIVDASTAYGNVGIANENRKTSVENQFDS